MCSSLIVYCLILFATTAGSRVFGLLAAKVTLTDGDDAALKRLEENVMKNSLSIPCEVGII